MIQLAKQSISQQIEDLKQEFEDHQSGELDYLVIAHTDSRMLQQIKTAFAGHLMAVVAIPQSLWAMGQDDVDELLDWAVNQLKVKYVLLVGHSLGGTPMSHIQVCNSSHSQNDQDSNGSRISGVFQRVQQAQAEVKEAEDFFIQELECLKSVPSVQSACKKQPQLIQGLFYRSESGVFCAYDCQRKTFRALVNNAI